MDKDYSPPVISIPKTYYLEIMHYLDDLLNICEESLLIDLIKPTEAQKNIFARAGIIFDKEEDLISIHQKILLKQGILMKKQYPKIKERPHYQTTKEKMNTFKGNNEIPGFRE
jgi:hypothetical protein